MSSLATSRVVRGGFRSVALLALCTSPLACLGRNDCSGPSGLCLEPTSGDRLRAADAGASTREVKLVVNSTGWAESSELGIAGAWYALSDGIGPPDETAADGTCEMAGHPASACASITTPLNAFPNTDGVLCTRGTVERMLDIVGSPGSPDYGDMWGAGIAFNFVIDHDNLSGAQSADMPYDATAYGVVGIAYDIDQVPRLRVAFPDSAHTNFAPVWNEEPGSGLSPVQPGHNRVFFQDVHPPTYAASKYDFDAAQLLSAQWIIPPQTSAAQPYAFCISNFSVIVAD